MSAAPSNAAGKSHHAGTFELSEGDPREGAGTSVGRFAAWGLVDRLEAISFVAVSAAAVALLSAGDNSF